VTTKQMHYLIEWVEAVAKDYHRDFKHGENTKDNAESWRDCTTTRCVRFRELLDGFTEHIEQEAAALLERLDVLGQKIEYAKKQWGGGAQ